MAVNPAVVKLIITAATDKRTWIVIGSIVCGIILMIVGIVAAFLNIFSFDDSGSSTASAAYVRFVDDMKYAYGKLDAEIDDKYPALDRDQIHAVFYTLYFGEEKIVDVNIRRLRMKVEDEPSIPKHLVTVWGMGYKWNTAE